MYHIALVCVCALAQQLFLLAWPDPLFGPVDAASTINRIAIITINRKAIITINGIAIITINIIAIVTINIMLI